MRPKLLKDAGKSTHGWISYLTSKRYLLTIVFNAFAALKNNLFIHEDGSVIEIHDDATEKKRKGKSPQKSAKKKEKTKLVACGECEGCLKKACKKCDACKRRKRCSLRACSDIRRIVISDEKTSNGKKNESDNEEEGDQSQRKTPKIRLRVGSSKKRKAASSQDDDDEEEEPESGGQQNTSSRKRARVSNGRRSSRSPAASEDEGEDDYDEMFDIETLEAKHKDLNEASFSEARNNMTLHGPWHLPPALESNDASFKEVAKITLINISRYSYYHSSLRY